MKKDAMVKDACNVSEVDDAVLHDVRDKMTSAQRIADMAELFKVLGDATRVNILDALSISELCVCDIAALLNMSNSAISHQLRVLKQAHIVRCRRVGRAVFYRMADGHITDLLRIAREHISEE